MVDRGNAIYNPLKFRYFDYSGRELVEKGKDGNIAALQDQFYALAEKANAVAYMIDGQVILSHLAGFNSWSGRR